MIKIQPITNALQKKIPLLHKKKYRDEDNAFLVEGWKCIEEVFKHTFEVECVVFLENTYSDAVEIIEICTEKKIPMYYAPKEIFSKFSDTVSPQPIISVVKKPTVPFVSISDILVLDGIQDPGNLGTILRTATWFGITNIILSNQCADIWSPKVVRSATGSLFSLAMIRSANLEETLLPLKETHTFYSTVLDGSLRLNECTFEGPSIIIMGSEAQGVSDEVLRLSDHKVFIEGREGKRETDSLNVGIATSLCCYQLSLFRK